MCSMYHVFCALTFAGISSLLAQPQTCLISAEKDAVMTAVPSAAFQRQESTNDSAEETEVAVQFCSFNHIEKEAVHFATYLKCIHEL